MISILPGRPREWNSSASASENLMLLSLILSPRPPLYAPTGNPRKPNGSGWTFRRGEAYGCVSGTIAGGRDGLTETGYRACYGGHSNRSARRFRRGPGPARAVAAAAAPARLPGAQYRSGDAAAERPPDRDQRPAPKRRTADRGAS